ncbi:hypothetical protein [Burkholderia guangdongensis]|uniref:hypothetical protein n=1 Tax=Burkholderia guangdongensis TaxID=1792500 RepID=UPI0015C7FE38|nr:hypothetical protein [Burkholderia guangdongensis]
MSHSSDLENSGSGPSSSAITLAIATVIGLWLPWAGFAYWYVHVGGFHSGIFVDRPVNFICFTLATWITIPLFTLIYVIYAKCSAPRNPYDQTIFVIESWILVALWILGFISYCL